MKKMLSVLSLILVFALASCGADGGDGGGGGGEKSALQKLLDAPHEYCSVTVITNLSELERLNSTYKIRAMSDGTTQINVSLQQLSEFEIKSGAYKPNKQNYIKTTEAFYIIEDGEVIKNVGGKNLDWTPTGEFPTFNVSDDYLENVSDFETYFSATITDVKGFAGWDISCTDATVCIYYDRDSVQSVYIEYFDAKGLKTQVNYTFDDNGRK